MWCQSAYEDATMKITGPFAKNWRFYETVHVAYAPDQDSPKGALARMYGSNEAVLPCKELGLANFCKARRRARRDIHLSVRDVPAIVDVHGFARLDGTFPHMCIR